MGKQWKTVHMMPVLPVLAEQKRLRSHPTNYWTLVMRRLKQIQAGIDHLWQSSISNIKILHRHTQSKWNILLMTVDCIFYIQIHLRWLEDRKLIWLRYDFMWFWLQAASIISLSRGGDIAIHVHHNNYHQYFSVILTKASVSEGVISKTKLSATMKGFNEIVLAIYRSYIFLNPLPTCGPCSYGKLLPLFHVHLNIASDWFLAGFHWKSTIMHLI